MVEHSGRVEARNRAREYIKVALQQAQVAYRVILNAQLLTPQERLKLLEVQETLRELYQRLALG